MHLQQACNLSQPETGRHTKHRHMIQNNTCTTATMRLQPLKHTSYFCYYFSPISKSPLHLYYAVRRTYVRLILMYRNFKLRSIAIRQPPESPFINGDLRNSPLIKGG